MIVFYRDGFAGTDSSKPVWKRYEGRAGIVDKHAAIVALFDDAHHKRVALTTAILLDNSKQPPVFVKDNVIFTSSYVECLKQRPDFPKTILIELNGSIIDSHPLKEIIKGPGL